jgi:hypothetical protein
MQGRSYRVDPVGRDPPRDFKKAGVGTVAHCFVHCSGSQCISLLWPTPVDTVALPLDI